jgi:hypothetical protein
MAEVINDPGTGKKIDKKVDRMINTYRSYNLIRKGTRDGFKSLFKYLIDEKIIVSILLLL